MTAHRRPIAVWLYAIALIIWVAWSAGENLEAVRVGLVSPFGAVAAFLPFLIGAVGFWFMRWWAVLILAGTGVAAIIIWPTERLVMQIAAVAVVVGPAIIVALLHRRAFRW